MTPSPNADSGRDIYWADFGPCRCGAPAGTACLDLRMGPKASISKPHRGRPHDEYHPELDPEHPGWRDRSAPPIGSGT